MMNLKNADVGYPTGPFSLGVGCVVPKEDKVLLVRITYGHRGWMLPGGYVKQNETIGEAAKREIMEETGLIVEPAELVAVRSRIKDGRNDIYVTFTVNVKGGELKPDGREIAEARYFTVEEMENRSDVPKLNPTIVRHILEPKNGFAISTFKPTPEERYELWI